MADVGYNSYESYNDENDASDVEPDDSASRHGAEEDDSPRVGSHSSEERPADSHVSHSTYKDIPSTPPSRHHSHRSSQATTPTTYVPSKKDRVRYSWQSIHEDEPNKPRINIIKIISNTATASAGFPQGEALAFSLSPCGKRIAAYNSARLFIFQTAALPVNLSHEYALPRRPLAVEICDDANILAVLADEHTVNIYDLSHNQACRMRTVRPDLPTNTVALSSTGALLAAAYEGGVEVFSLAPSALITDRRAIRAPKMDKLVFSQDDSTILGTTTRIFASNTVVVSVPVFPSANTGTPSHQELKEAWCSGMLEPQNIRNSSHATFMREGGVMTNEKVFSWNGLEDTFGLLSLQDMVYSQVDFPVAISPPLSTCGGLGAAIHHIPSIDEHGKIAAMIVNDRTVRLYIVPRDIGDGASKVEAHSIDHELDEEYGCPFTDLRWVHSPLNLPAPQYSHNQIRGRLVVTSPGGLLDPDQAEHMIQDVEGGRIILFDFDPQFAGQPGQTFVFNLGKAPPLTLEEEQMDVATEIDLVRRRTVTSNRSNTLGKKTPSLGRAATTISRRQDHDAMPQRSVGSAGSLRTPPTQTNSSPWRNRRNNASVISISADASRSLPDLLEASELNAEPIEEPYTQGAPRSVASLHRAATAANARRFQALEEHEAETEHPGDLPLPAYTELPNQPLPGRYRALAGLEIPARGRYLQEDGSPVSALATAPPTVPDHHWPSSTATLSPDYAVTQRFHRPFNNPISPASMAPSTLASDWSNDTSPDLRRAPTHLTLRTQPSWETVSTNAQTNTQPPSTLRSQPSWESPGNMSFFSPEMRTTGSRTAPSSPEQTRPNQMVHGLGLHSFRHSLLLPDESEERPFNAASDPSSRIMHRPPHVNAFHAVNHALTTNLTPSNHSGERRSGSSISGVSAVSANSRDVTPTSAGTAAYPVTGWYPPAPPSPLESRPSMSVRLKTTGQISRSGSTARSFHSSGRPGHNAVMEFRPPPTLRRSRSVENGRKAWFAKKRREDAVGGSTLPKVGVGVREDLMAYEAQGKRCVVILNGTAGLSRNDSLGGQAIDSTVDFSGTNALLGNRKYTWQDQLAAKESGIYRISLARAFPPVAGSARNDIFAIGSLYTNSPEVAEGYRLLSNGGIRSWSPPISTVDGWDNIAQTVYLETGVHDNEFSLGITTAVTVEARLSWVTSSVREAELQAAEALAKKVDSPIVFAFAESPASVGITLEAHLDELISRVSAANPNTVVVLNNAESVLMPWLHSVSAVLGMGYPGQKQGYATTDLLLEIRNPQGRLPITYPASVNASVARNQ